MLEKKRRNLQKRNFRRIVSRNLSHHSPPLHSLLCSNPTSSKASLALRSRKIGQYVMLWLKSDLDLLWREDKWLTSATDGGLRWMRKDGGGREISRRCGRPPTETRTRFFGEAREGGDRSDGRQSRRRRLISKLRRRLLETRAMERVN
ncbi:unnamed protein product [Microthlaspi erraticum]|uniref:Uncharacterized protein n=1 Tax=Microthlaspi erraticum TaxID=1685480 RepID=A0A6D2K5Y0_9BRAS|nr:unnamed protein product [Microthlaspi erraticum]